MIRKSERKAVTHMSMNYYCLTTFHISSTEKNIAFKGVTFSNKDNHSIESNFPGKGSHPDFG